MYCKEIKAYRTSFPELLKSWNHFRIIKTQFYLKFYKLCSVRLNLLLRLHFHAKILFSGSSKFLKKLSSG